MVGGPAGAPSPAVDDPAGAPPFVGGAVAVVPSECSHEATPKRKIPLIKTAVNSLEKRG